MSWQPQAPKDVLHIRAQLYAQVRDFFQTRDVVEVDTPILNQYAVTDQHIDSVIADDFRFLHTSPEYAMKRLLAFHKCDIYQLCKVFRANEKGSYHNTEFTMLEWYRVGWGYKDLMREVEELVALLISNHMVLNETKYISYQEIFIKYASINITTAQLADYLQVFADHSIELSSALTNQQYQELVLDQIIIPKMEKNRMTFIYDYPEELAALARLNDQSLAERFELYLGGVELANGFQELTDVRQQRTRFEEDNRKRLLGGKKAIEIDVEFINALEAGLPESAGVALGVDRLLMAMLDAKHINEVLNFS